MLDPVQFKEIYSRYQCSGLTVRDFCRTEGLAEARFYYWQHKLKSSLPDKRGFVPLIISPSDPSMTLQSNFREKSCELPPDAHYEIIYPSFGVDSRLLCVKSKAPLCNLQARRLASNYGIARCYAGHGIFISYLLNLTSVIMSSKLNYFFRQMILI